MPSPNARLLLLDGDVIDRLTVFRRVLAQCAKRWRDEDARVFGRWEDDGGAV